MKLFKTMLAASLAACTLTPMALLPVGMELPTDISQKSKPATIKVLVSKQKEGIFLEAKGHHFIYNPLNEILLFEESSTKQVLSTGEKGLKWGELFPGIFQIRIVPADSQSTILVDGIEYRGCVEIYDLKGKLYAVNEVDIERYLKSIMTAQFSTELDEEVMDAVAITARTNAYYLASRMPESYWHVESQDVGYQGYAVTLQNLHVDRAINNTRHMVMLYKGAPFPTAWTKNSAGKTADYTTIFRKNVRVPHGVDSPFAAHDREKHAWTFSISKKDLAKALGAVKVNEFDLYQDDRSQKVYGARLKDNADVLQFDFTKLQSALGATRLKSNDFTVEANGDQLIFKGFGEGSGVGLCLFSASAMADKGDKASKILVSFFPDTQLENIPSFDGKTTTLKTKALSSLR
jgi:stage II sporulation protein D